MSKLYAYPLNPTNNVDILGHATLDGDFWTLPTPVVEIDNWVDALQHYQSFSGEDRNVSARLLNEIINSNDMQKNKQAVIAANIEAIKKSDSICKKESGKYENPGTAKMKHGVGIDTCNWTTGNITLSVKPYDVNWNKRYVKQLENGECEFEVSFNYTREVSFDDEYKFDTEITKFKQIFTDIIPGLYAGRGKQYTIHGEWKEIVDEKFIIVCKNS